jgi:ARC6-like, IMS domain
MSVDRDWRDIVTMGCAVGGSIVIGGIFGVNHYFFPQKFADPSKTLQPAAGNVTTSSGSLTGLTDSNATSIITQWLEAKKKVFGPSYEKSFAQNILTGLAYEKNITSNSKSADERSSVDDLQNDGMYYTYENQQVHQITSNQSSNDKAMIKAVVSETRFLHNTRLGNVKTSSSNQKTVCYEFSVVNNAWRISKTPELFSSCS